MTKSKDWKDWLKNWLGLLIGILLMTVGLVGIVVFGNSVLHSVSEATFVAGVLTITVDPFLKRRLIKEAGEDIFHHLLGFELPIEIRESLREFLFATKHYRTDVVIDVGVKHDRDGALVEVKMRSKVVAARNTEYAQLFACEESERPVLKVASITSTLTPKLSYSEKDVHLSPKKDEPRVFEWHGKTIKLRKGEHLLSYFEYTVKKKLSDFYVIYFGSPVVYPRLRVEAEDGLEISASKPDQQNANEYLYQKVFVVGDHINIRWWPKRD